MLALAEKAQALGIMTRTESMLCKLLGIAFTTAIGILVRSREKGLVTGSEVLTKLATLAKHGVIKNQFWKMQTEIGDKTMSQTRSIGMDRENFEFLNELTKEQRSDLSKAVRDMVTRRRILLRWNATKRGRHLSAGPLSLPESLWER